MTAEGPGGKRSRRFGEMQQLFDSPAAVEDLAGDRSRRFDGLEAGEHEGKTQPFIELQEMFKELGATRRLLNCFKGDCELIPHAKKPTDATCKS